MTNDSEHVKEVSQRLKNASRLRARKIGCKIRYLDCSRERKKDLALETAQRDGVRSGRD